MTSEWMAGAQMREWANQSLPRSKEREETATDGTEAPQSPEAVGQRDPLLPPSPLERAKQAFASLNDEERRQLIRWLFERGSQNG